MAGNSPISSTPSIFGLPPTSALILLSLRDAAGDDLAQLPGAPCAKFRRTDIDISID
jgi:hypothetical protein